jgi:ligand-binding sensor domain-containing protein
MVFRLIPTILCILICATSFAQKGGRFVEASQDISYHFTVTSYSTNQGLPESQVVDIAPTNGGSLLLATADGIVSYDGQEFTEFIEDQRYKNHYPNDLLWDEYSRRLFVNEFGGNLYIFHPYYKKLQSCSASTLVNHTLYCLNEAGDLLKADTKELVFKRTAKTGVKKAISLHVAYPFVYIGTDTGISVYNMTTKKVSQLSNEGTITRFYTNPYNHQLFALGIKQIYALTSKSATPSFELTVPETDAIIKDMVAVSSEEYYVSTTHGLHYITPDYQELFRTEVLPSDNLIALYFNEKEGCLFAGSIEKGLLRLLLKTCYSDECTSDGGLRQSSSTSIITTYSGEVLVAGSGGRIVEIGIGETYDYWSYPVHFVSLAAINSFVYAGTWGDGIYILKDRKLVYHVTKKQLGGSSGDVHASFKDSQGTIWVGTGNGIAKGRDHKSIKPYLQQSVTGIIICFYELSNGNICIGSNEGVYILDKHYQLITKLGKQQGLIGKEVRCFYEDASKKVWIGAYNGGLYCYDQGKLTSINRKKNSKLSDDVFTLAKDQFGYLNMTSNFGLWKISEADLNDFYTGKLDYLIPFFFGEETGILNPEFNGGFQNNYLLTKHHHFYFPCLQGIVIHTPEHYKFSKTKPLFLRIWVNDTLYKADSHVFERSTHTLQFDFSSPRFCKKDNYFFQYKLLGGNFPDHWSKLEKTPSISFKMLPPGKYKLKIRAVNAFNDKHPPEIIYAFEIKAYFYETAWFRVTSIILFLLLIILLVRLRIAYVSSKDRHMNSINNTILELKLKAIQAKMNPHFIFNALNNIQYLIVLKKLDLAETAINEFSQLLRKFLQQSDQSFVTVEEEFEMLRLYVAIEKFRFNEQLVSRFKIDYKIGQYYIPSMLLQPVVENALKHGLLHSEKERILQVHAFSYNDKIRITIEDNGIGREASLEINKSREEHISHGFNLVQEKIKIVQEKYGIVVRFELNDITEDSMTGTRVIFDIPNIKEAFTDT